MLCQIFPHANSYWCCWIWSFWILNFKQETSPFLVCMIFQWFPEILIECHRVTRNGWIESHVEWNRKRTSFDILNTYPSMSFNESEIFSTDFWMTTRNLIIILTFNIRMAWMFTIFKYLGHPTTSHDSNFSLFPKPMIFYWNWDHYLGEEHKIETMEIFSSASSHSCTIESRACGFSIIKIVQLELCRMLLCKTRNLKSLGMR